MPESTLPDDNAPETALRVDPRFTEPQKRALLAVYRSYIGPNGPGTADDAADVLLRQVGNEATAKLGRGRRSLTNRFAADFES
jgi:hypothetical protein